MDLLASRANQDTEMVDVSAEEPTDGQALSLRQPEKDANQDDARSDRSRALTGLHASFALQIAETALSDDQSESEGESEPDISEDFAPAVSHNGINPPSIIHCHRQKPAYAGKPPRLSQLPRSRDAPGRGLYQVGWALKQENLRVIELETLQQRIAAELNFSRSLQAELHTAVTIAESDFSRLARLLGCLISCGQITRSSDHGGYYAMSDPNLDLFVESAEMSLSACNFRCEARVEGEWSNPEYVVDFWPIVIPQPRCAGENTWGGQYPNLYRLATLAAYHPSETISEAGKSLLRSLPGQQSPFSSGWLFEYRPEPARADHPVMSRRWSYRSAHKISISVHKQQVEVEGGNTVETGVADGQLDGSILDYE